MTRCASMFRVHQHRVPWNWGIALGWPPHSIWVERLASEPPKVEPGGAESYMVDLVNAMRWGRDFLAIP